MLIVGPLWSRMSVDDGKFSISDELVEITVPREELEHRAASAASMGFTIGALVFVHGKTFAPVVAGILNGRPTTKTRGYVRPTVLSDAIYVELKLQFSETVRYEPGTILFIDYEDPQIDFALVLLSDNRKYWFPTNTGLWSFERAINLNAVLTK